MTILKKSILIIFLLNIFISNTTLFSQEVPHSVKNTGVYDFLDELANNQIIEINSAIKPYSRLFISNRLREADSKREQLTSATAERTRFLPEGFRERVSVQGRIGKDVQTSFITRIPSFH